jgi:Flp pilus assembly pilin Flp
VGPGPGPTVFLTSEETAAHMLPSFRLNGLEDQQGQTMTETAVVMSLIVVVVIVAVIFYGNRLEALWNMLSQTLPSGS